VPEKLHLSLPTTQPIIFLLLPFMACAGIAHTRAAMNGTLMQFLMAVEVKFYRKKRWEPKED